MHSQKSHCNYKRLVKEFNLFGYTYKGIIKDCKDICQNCTTCVQKHKKFFKREPCMQMIFTHVYERYIADLTELTNELTNNRKYLYLLNIIVHFSKYVFSYILEKKTVDIILYKIKDSFLNHGYPEEFGSDNGSEFSNKKLNEYILSKNIKFIHGKAFNLLSYKLDKGDNFDLPNILSKVLYNYNNTIHETTQFKAFEVFYTNNEDIKEKIYFNTLNSFKKINVDASIFTSTEKVLLYNNFIVENTNKKEERII